MQMLLKRAQSRLDAIDTEATVGAQLPVYFHEARPNSNPYLGRCVELTGCSEELPLEFYQHRYLAIAESANVLPKGQMEVSTAWNRGQIVDEFPNQDDRRTFFPSIALRVGIAERVEVGFTSGVVKRGGLGYFAVQTDTKIHLKGRVWSDMARRYRIAGSVAVYAPVGHETNRTTASEWNFSGAFHGQMRVRRLTVRSELAYLSNSARLLHNQVVTASYNERFPDRSPSVVVAAAGIGGGADIDVTNRMSASADVYGIRPFSAVASMAPAFSAGVGYRFDLITVRAQSGAIWRGSDIDTFYGVTFGVRAVLSQ
ncbi:MAG: hypothetical protein ABIS29_16975 [Vicinamibacterales bacterium]